MNTISEEFIKLFWPNLGLQLKISAHILNLLCGCLLARNWIIDKHFQVDFSDNSELILIKLSTFLEFAEVTSACEVYSERLEWDSFSRSLRKWDRSFLVMLAMKVEVKFMFQSCVLWFIIWLKQKHLAKFYLIQIHFSGPGISWKKEVEWSHKIWILILTLFNTVDLSFSVGIWGWSGDG